MPVRSRETLCGWDLYAVDNRGTSMKFKDLREFISFLEQKGEIRRIQTPVSCDLEITEITDRVIKQGGPALLFENVTGYDMPVAINIFGSEQRMAWALGVEKLDDLVERVQGLLQLMHGPPEGMINKLRTLGQLVHMGSFQPKTVRNAPCQQVVLQGDEVDLFKFPILKCWPLDGGRFITLPLVITRDPETGVQNYGIYRLQVYDRNTTGMHWQTHKVGSPSLPAQPGAARRAHGGGRRSGRRPGLHMDWLGAVAAGLGRNGGSRLP